jgi:low temperature requirement protein LtrA
VSGVDTPERPAVAPSAEAAEAPDPERRTSSVELFWDLVFVFAVTQVTTLLARHLSWAGFGRSMLILALMWWAWSAFVWVANAQADDSRRLRLTLLLSSAFIFISGLAVPQAFGAEGMLFAVTYAVVRFLHLALGQVAFGLRILRRLITVLLVLMCGVESWGPYAEAQPI